MLRFLVDENIDLNIIRGLIARKPDLDIISVRDVGLAATPDPIILEWAAQAGRVLITHDVSTMSNYAYQRVAAELPMLGVIELRSDASIGAIIEDLLILVEASREGEYENRVVFIPL